MSDLLLVVRVRVVVDSQCMGQPVDAQLPHVAAEPESHTGGGVSGRLGAVLEGGVELPHQLRVCGVLYAQERPPVWVADGGSDLLHAVELLEDAPHQVVVSVEHPVKDPDGTGLHTRGEGAAPT
ncbi:unnamed protein product [Linum trigynum]|uniref:Uncharacterized protein n=1 Tax=Linum trigynum TaxID=586398 RepID=A0AAV2EPQ2_9ROSI